jgi:hypothetical protein
MLHARSGIPPDGRTVEHRDLGLSSQQSYLCLEFLRFVNIVRIQKAYKVTSRMFDAQIAGSRSASPLPIRMLQQFDPGHIGLDAAGGNFQTAILRAVVNEEQLPFT